VSGEEHGQHLVADQVVIQTALYQPIQEIAPARAANRAAAPNPPKPVPMMMTFSLTVSPVPFA
jgi:hypothetical protein